ncbi:MAG: hypothetical protein SFV18_12465 [Bryobacteraceae bacterium]|nr:hypothetical protein [Bryobacteraceae bacterium]
MDTQTKIREMIAGLSDAQKALIAQELTPPAAARRNLEDITPDKLRDPAMAAQIRADIVAALKGEI